MQIFTCLRVLVGLKYTNRVSSLTSHWIGWAFGRIEDETKGVIDHLTYFDADRQMQIVFDGRQKEHVAAPAEDDSHLLLAFDSVYYGGDYSIGLIFRVDNLELESSVTRE